MMRVLISGFFFLAVVLFETSFLSSVPSVLAMTPLVFALSVYLIQHQNRLDGVFWLIGYGIFLEAFHLSVIPLPFLPYAFAATASFISARQVFSNRSLYGIAGCALTGWATAAFGEALIKMGASLAGHSVPNWGMWLQTISLRALLLIGAIYIIFYVARPFQHVWGSRL
ncbi:hypothetical protein HZA85_03465 [Candidatus Uhrbacteria bacterium]|nr:hypothetical protein [Candidatus Uhrbacteria bacterium]